MMWVGVVGTPICSSKFIIRTNFFNSTVWLLGTRKNIKKHGVRGNIFGSVLLHPQYVCFPLLSHQHVCVCKLPSSLSLFRSLGDFKFDFRRQLLYPKIKHRKTIGDKRFVYRRTLICFLSILLSDSQTKNNDTITISINRLVHHHWCK